MNLISFYDKVTHLVDQENSMDFCQWTDRWGLGKGSAPEGGGHGTGCAVGTEQAVQWAWNKLCSGHSPELQEFKENSGQLSQIYGLIFGCSCLEPGVGLSDPCWTEWVPSNLGCSTIL